MPNHLIDVGARPSLDLVSYARRGPGRDRLSPAEIDRISHTVHRAPEVMVKVLIRGGQDLKAVQGHFSYLDREGDLAIETDEGEQLIGRGVEKELLEDWDLDVEELRRRSDLGPRKDRAPPKLVHKVLFSMPAGTPPVKVLRAVQNFAREEFALQHRYAMVLHTDEPHPHVHMVIKAMSEQGVRLNIRKAMLRDWRRKFADQLSREGVAANATERAARGAIRVGKTDGIYRAQLRGESKHMRDRAYSVALELQKGTFTAEPGKGKLRETRRAVNQGWWAVSEILTAEGHRELAAQVRRFAQDMPPPLTEREQIATSILLRARRRPDLDQSLTR